MLKFSGHVGILRNKELKMTQKKQQNSHSEIKQALNVRKCDPKSIIHFLTTHHSKKYEYCTTATHSTK